MFKKTQPTVNDSLRIGIWLHEIFPGGFTGEGISRLLAWIILASQQHNDFQFKIACIAWVKKPFKKHLDELGVDTSRIEFITVPGFMPFLYPFYSRWMRRQKKEQGIRKKINIFNILKKIVLFVLSWTLGLPVFLSLPILLFFGVVALPFAIIHYGMKIFNRLRHIAARIITRSFRTSTQEEPAQYSIPAGGRKFRTKVENPVTGIGRRLYHLLIRAEQEALVRRAARDKSIDGWFFAFPRNPLINRFKTPKILAVPDLVYLDFPSPFARELPELLADHSEFEKTIRAADAVITYSEFVKMSQVVTPGFQPTDHVHVVRHAPVETRSFINPDSGAPLSQVRAEAIRIISEYIQSITANKTDRMSLYIRELPFGDFNYLFVSSQTRPHKNHLNLIKTYDTLLREKYFNLKLIFTGRFNPEIDEYIHDKKLHLDVLSIPQLPARVHASFYAGAKMAVAPTLFEGGFTTVFTEALSVGTPALVSDIPVAREILSVDQRKIVCFDPYDMNDMLEKITWGLEHHQELLHYETGIYQELMKRNWDDVANEYIDVFKSTIRNNKKR